MTDESSPESIVAAFSSQPMGRVPGPCFYRVREEGYVDIWAMGHHVVVPIASLALLPETIARAVLAKLKDGKTAGIIDINSGDTAKG